MSTAQRPVFLASYVDGGELYVPADFFHNAYGYTVTASGTDVSIGV